jgi:hypothetical protein
MKMTSEIERLERRERENPASLTEDDRKRLAQLREYRDSDPEDDAWYDGNDEDD